MGDELKEVFDKAKQELTHLYYRWIMFVQMFGDNAHRIEIINRTSSNLLMEFHWLVLDNMVLSISKLTDPAEMRGNSNLSLPYLIEEIDKTEKKDIVPELRAILEELNTAVEHFRRIRNKRIAHNDLAAALDDGVSPLPGVSRADINNALKLTGVFLNKIEDAFFNSTTAYDLTILPLTNDGRSLIIRLQKSLAYDQLEDSEVVENGMWRELGNIDEKDV